MRIFISNCFTFTAFVFVLSISMSSTALATDDTLTLSSTETGNSLAIASVADSNTDVENSTEKTEEIPFFVKLWPFGPYGFICQHVAPVAYTMAMQEFFLKLGGCYIDQENK